MSLSQKPVITLQVAKQKLAEARKLFSANKYKEAAAISKTLAPAFKQAQEAESYLRCLYICAIYMTSVRLVNEEAQNIVAEIQTFKKKQLTEGNADLLVELLLQPCIYYANRGDNKKALTEAKLLLKQQEKFLKPNAPSIKMTKEAICFFYREIGIISLEALQFIQQYIEQLSAKPSQNAKHLINAYAFLGKLITYATPLKALQNYYKAIELHFELVNNKNGQLANLYRAVAVVYFEQKDFDSALEYFHKALEIDEALNLTNHILINYMNIGNCYKEKQLWNTALIYYKKVEKEEDTTSPTSKIYLYFNFAEYYLVRKQFTETEKYAAKALAICKKFSFTNSMSLALIYGTMADVYWHQNKYQKAIAYNEKAKEALGEEETIESHSYLCTYNNNIAKCFFEQNKYIKAINKIQINLLQLLKAPIKNTNNYYYTPSIKLTNNNSTLLEVLLFKAQFLKAYYHQSSNNTKDLQKAIFTYQLADKTLTEIRNSLLLENSKLSLSHQTEQLYQGAIMATVAAAKVAQKNDLAFLQNAYEIAELNQQHYPTETHPYITTHEQAKALAFKFCEKNKGLILLDNIIKNKVKTTAIVEDKITQKETEIQTEIHLLNQQITQTFKELNNLEEHNNEAKEAKIKQLTKLEMAYANHKKQYEDVLAEIKEKYPQYHQIKHQNNIVSIENLQSKLQSKQALLNYFIGETSIYIFCVTTSNFEVYTLAKPQPFKQLVAQLHKAINRIKHTLFTQVSHQLYELLIHPAQQLLQAQNIKELIIIPHKEINYIPFEALLTTNTPTAKIVNFQQLPYLIHQYNISYHYSASLLFQSISSSQIAQSIPLSDSFVSFAPVYGDNLGDDELEQPNNTTMGGKASFSHNIPQEAVRSVRIGNTNFSELLYSEEELKGIAKLFQQQNIPTQTYLHQKASLEQLKIAVKNKKYIHIAAHGYEEEKNKEMVGIVLSPNQINTDTDTDTKASIMFLNDTYTLQLNADLVVLSCCKSGIGTIAQGEGIMAMNRGFLYAGAKNVIYTLFKVYDKASSQLVQSFFQQHLQQKQSYSQALQTAKLQMISNPLYTPKHWAGFVLIGN